MSSFWNTLYSRHKSALAAEVSAEKEHLRMRTDLQFSNGRASGLVDVLDRVLDKGLVVAGDVKISLAEVELLTIRIRLIVCSIDKAQQIGLDWWKYDAHLSPNRNRLSAENDELRRQVRLLERKVASLTSRKGGSTRRDGGRDANRQGD
ncbi:MAG TPA: gas vesicle protein [Candidatus Binatia bacterium]|nr:gas vesicle protein [Candidatus Binatia bacterium]